MKFVMGDDVGVRCVLDDTGKYIQIFSVPVWVSETGFLLDGAKAGRKIVFLNSDKERDCVVLSIIDIDCGRCFKILERAGVYVSSDRKVRELIRLYLSSGFDVVKINIPHGIIKFKMEHYGGLHRSDGELWYGFSYLRNSKYGKLIAVPDPCYSSKINCLFEVLNREECKSAVLKKDFLFAVGASLASPIVGGFGFSGVILNFYNKLSDSLVDLACQAVGVWSGERVVGFRFPICSPDVVELKRQYRDCVVCVDVASYEKNSKLHTFFKRYFKGRKGAEGGVSGVVVTSSGEVIGNCVSSRKCCSVGVFAQDVIVINIKSSYDIDSKFQLLGVGERFIMSICSNFPQSMEKINDLYHESIDRFRISRRSGVSKAVQSFFALSASVLEYAIGIGLLPSVYVKGSAIDAISAYFKEIFDVDDKYWNVLYEIHNSIGSFMCVSCSLKDNDFVLVRSKYVKYYFDNSVDFDGFINWLIDNRVVIKNSNGGAISICHVPDGKTTRGYRLSVKAMKKMMDRIPKNVLVMNKWSEGAEKYREMFKNHPITK